MSVFGQAGLLMLYGLIIVFGALVVFYLTILLIGKLFPPKPEPGDEQHK